MKKFLLLSAILISVSSCGTNGNDAYIEEVKAEKDVLIEQEKTKQMEIQLKIEKEKSSQAKQKKQ